VPTRVELERQDEMTTTTSTTATIVRVKVEEGKAGLFYATSPDLKGLLVAEPSIDALDAAIPRVITDMYAACGVHVVVTKARDEDPEFYPWVAIPADVAHRMMETERGKSQ
jgi:hypothetical protein